jgi:predicted nucleic acid-binding protein
MFLLDTNVISELRRPERANRNVAAWAGSIPLASFFLSAISILEMRLGRSGLHEGTRLKEPSSELG